MRGDPTIAHQWGGILILDVVGQLEQESLSPDGTVRERSLVQVVVAVQLSLDAKSVPSFEALFAATTSIVHVTPTDSVAFLEDLGIGTNGFYDTCTLVTEAHVGFAVVKICTLACGR